MRNADLEPALLALDALGAHRLPVKAALGVVRLRKALQAILDPVREVHDELVRRHSGGMDQITADHAGFRDFRVDAAELAEALVTEEIPVLKLKEADLEAIEPNVLYALSEILEIEEA